MSNILVANNLLQHDWYFSQKLGFGPLGTVYRYFIQLIIVTLAVAYDEQVRLKNCRKFDRPDDKLRYMARDK